MRLVSSHVNTYNSALRLLVRWGFKPGVELDGDGLIRRWTATRDGEHLVAESPLELLGRAHLGSDLRRMCARSALRRVAWEGAAGIARVPVRTLLSEGLEGLGPRWAGGGIPWVHWVRAITGLALRDYLMVTQADWLAGVGQALREGDVSGAVAHCDGRSEEAGEQLVALAQLLFHPEQALASPLRPAQSVAERFWTDHPRQYGAYPRWLAGRVA